ncbi:hypothetical protein B0H16DRAFT_1586740 [Mycena metata]|uniref:Uncharacterized protein n=1 Tax=Mycena metata TaxID=1033252 RepID=A0AAD7MS10_9AGAR|nr:hypothetical protein B0H16DRAFT_1586740 [Mycena metata]
MPIELPSPNERQTPAPEGTSPTASAGADEDVAGTATDDLLLAQTLRDCLTSLPQSLLLSAPPGSELNDDSERSPLDLADSDEQESEVVQIAKLVRRSLYIMARLGDPVGVYQLSSSENAVSFTPGNNLTEILRDCLGAVMAMQAILDEQRSLAVNSPNVETSPDPNPSPTPNPQITPNLTLGQLMGNTTGPPWGNDIMKPLCEALYTEPFDEKNKIYLECIAASYDTVAYCDNGIKTSDDYINRIRCFVGFLEQSRGNGTVAEFLDVVRAQIPGWALGEKEYANVLYGFWTLLHWPLWVPDSGVTFKNKVDTIFPRLKKWKQPPSFSVTLSDIFGAGLDIAPTQFSHEHLLITDNEVKIFCPSMNQMKALEKFATNRAAISLQIGSLGAEIFASLYKLYGKKKEFDRARSLRLLPKYDQDNHELLLSILFELHAVVNKTEPQVLGSRVLALDSLIRRRHSWMVSLMRDMKINKREQPFLFWGSIVAFLFGICTVIQTVTAVWALQLALVAS